MHDTTPLGHSFALDLSALQQADICLYTLWDNDLLLGCGAIQELSPVHGELKSMRTHPDHLRKGVASKILEHLIITEIQRNHHRVSLETGCAAEFEPAIALYKKFGFIKGCSFSNYKNSNFNQFFHLDLKKVSSSI